MVPRRIRLLVQVPIKEVLTVLLNGTTVPLAKELVTASTVMEQENTNIQKMVNAVFVKVLVDVLDVMVKAAGRINYTNLIKTIV